MRIGTGDPWALTELAKAGGLGGGGGGCGGTYIWYTIHGLVFGILCWFNYRGLLLYSLSVARFVMLWHWLLCLALTGPAETVGQVGHLPYHFLVVHTGNDVL